MIYIDEESRYRDRGSRYGDRGAEVEDDRGGEITEAESDMACSHSYSPVHNSPISCSPLPFSLLGVALELIYIPVPMFTFIMHVVCSTLQSASKWSLNFVVFCCCLGLGNQV